MCGAFHISGRNTPRFAGASLQSATLTGARVPTGSDARKQPDTAYFAAFRLAAGRRPHLPESRLSRRGGSVPEPRPAPAQLDVARARTAVNSARGQVWMSWEQRSAAGPFLDAERIPAAIAAAAAAAAHTGGRERDAECAGMAQGARQGGAQLVGPSGSMAQQPGWGRGGEQPPGWGRGGEHRVDPDGRGAAAEKTESWARGGQARDGGAGDPGGGTAPATDGAAAGAAGAAGAPNGSGSAVGQPGLDDGRELTNWRKRTDHQAAAVRPPPPLLLFSLPLTLLYSPHQAAAVRPAARLSPLLAARPCPAQDRHPRGSARRMTAGGALAGAGGCADPALPCRRTCLGPRGASALPGGRRLRAPPRPQRRADPRRRREQRRPGPGAALLRTGRGAA